jgi:hypothetical protein
MKNNFCVVEIDENGKKQQYIRIRVEKLIDTICPVLSGPYDRIFSGCQINGKAQ